MSRPLTLRRVFLVPLFGALAACGAQDPAATPDTMAPAAAAAADAPVAEPASAPDATADAGQPAIGRTDKLAAFIRQHYGDTAALKGDWSASWEHEGETYDAQRSVCAEQSVAGGDGMQQLLAVCGQINDGGHAAPGTIDFFVLRDAGDRFEQVTALTDQVFGSSGNPGQVSILRAGSDFYGFRVVHGWYGQGYALVSQDLILPGPKGLAAAGSLRSSIDNTGAYECEDAATADAECSTDVFNVDFELQFDQTDPGARIWPLTVLETGNDCGGKRVHEAHRIAFDQASWTYAFPESLTRESCR